MYRLADRTRLALIALLLLSLVLTGCGSSGDGGGDDGRLASGIEGTGIVSGFGSIFVDGIEFSTDEATILVDGRSADESALSVGDIVTVSGRMTGESQAVAERIVFVPTIEGPIESARIDEGVGTIVVLDQDIVIDDNTVLVDIDASSLRSGQQVSISALYLGDGQWIASSVESASSSRSSREIEGEIEALSSNEFSLGSLRVRFDASALTDIDTPLSEGRYVRVEGRRVSEDSALVARRIERVERGPSGDDAQVFRQGIIRNVESLSRFEIDGQPVDASAISFDRGVTASDLSGLLASVQGDMQGDVLVADSLFLARSPSALVEAPIEAIDGNASEITLLGTTAVLNPTTRYRDESRAGDRGLGPNSLASGQTVRLAIFEDDGRLLASRVTRTAVEPTSSARLRGAIDDAPDVGGVLVIRIAGSVAIGRPATTRFESADGDALSFESFAARLRPGTRVEARGPTNGGRIDTARSIRLIDPE